MEGVDGCANTMKYAAKVTVLIPHLIHITAVAAPSIARNGILVFMGCAVMHDSNYLSLEKIIAIICAS